MIVIETFERGCKAQAPTKRSGSGSTAHDRRHPLIIYPRLTDYRWVPFRAGQLPRPADGDLPPSTSPTLFESDRCEKKIALPAQFLSPTGSSLISACIPRSNTVYPPASTR